MPSRAVTVCGIRPSDGGSGPRGHADERRLPRGGSPPESGYQRWPAATDPQTPTMPETSGLRASVTAVAGPNGHIYAGGAASPSGVTQAGPRALPGTPLAFGAHGRAMGPAPRWETAPAPDGGPAARTLNPPGAGRQPISHGSCSRVGSWGGTECHPSPSHILSGHRWEGILHANVNLLKSSCGGAVLLWSGPCASLKLGHFFVTYRPWERTSCESCVRPSRRCRAYGLPRAALVPRLGGSLAPQRPQSPKPWSWVNWPTDAVNWLTDRQLAKHCNWLLLTAQALHCQTSQCQPV